MKKFTKITALLLALTIVAVFAGCSCKETSKYSYWNIERYELSNGEPLTYYTEFNVQRENSVREIWINIDHVVGSSIEVGFNFGSNVSGKATIPTSVLEATGGWYKLSIDKLHSVSTVKVIFTGPVHVNEVVVVDAKDKVCKLTFKAYGEKATSTSNSRNEYTAEDL